METTFRTNHSWKRRTYWLITLGFLIGLLPPTVIEAVGSTAVLIGLGIYGLGWLSVLWGGLGYLRIRSSLPDWAVRPFIFGQRLLLLGGIGYLFSLGGPSTAEGVAAISGLAPQSVNQQFGSFATDIAIDIPGFRGLEPDLRLVYNSSGGNGFVGRGWSLAGVSLIQRASAGGGAPAYTAQDRYYLDGEELIADTSLGGTHSTSHQSFRRITWDSANNRWLVWTKDGTQAIYEQLYLTGSGTYRWARTRMIDSHGNTVQYNYWCESGQDCYLDTITYNRTTIRLYREARPDPLQYTHGAGLATMNYRLKSIDVLVQGQRARIYQLSYTTGATTNNSVLTQVQQFGRDATINSNGAVTGGSALPAIQLGHTNAGDVHNHSLTAGTANEPLWGWEKRNRWMTGDVNGDGKDDYIYVARHGAHDSYAGDHVVLHTAISKGDGQYSYHGQDTNWSWHDDFQWMTGDVNGDHKTDIMLVAFHGPHGDHAGTHTMLHAALSRGNGSYDLTGQETGWGFTPTANQQWLNGDLNGDGRSDFIMIYNANNVVRIHAALSQGNGTYALTGYDMPWGFAAPPNQQWMVGDVNGDGKTDVIMIYNAAGIARFHIAFSKGNGEFRASGYDSTWGFTAPPHQQWMIGDVNGDGKTDLVMIYNAAGKVRIHAAVSHGNGAFALSGQDTVWGWHDEHRWMVGDANGDGRSDVMLAGIHGAHGDYTGQHTVLHKALSKGNGTYTFTAQDTHWAWSKYSRWSAGDVNGDGKSDFMFVYLPYHLETVQETVQVPVTVSGSWEGIHTVRGVRGSDNKVQFRVFPSGGSETKWVGFPIDGATPSGSWEKTGGAKCSDVILRDIKGVGNTLEVTIGSQKTVITLGGGITASGHVHYAGNDCGNDGRVGIQGNAGALWFTYNGWNEWKPISLTRSEVRSRQVEVNDGLRFHAAFATGNAPDVVTSVKNELGGTMRVNYVPSTAWPDRQAPQVVHPTVQRLTVSDGRGNDSATTFGYAGVRWDSTNRRYLGFRTAHVPLDSQGNHVVTLFRQTAASQPGMVDAMFLRDKDGKNYAEQRYEYNETGQAPYHSLLTGRWDLEYELQATPRRIYTQWIYDGYGNVAQVREHGDADGDGDERTTVTQYVPNTAKYLVNYPAVISIYAGLGTGGTKASEHIFYYDGNPDHAKVPTRGLITKAHVWNKQANTYHTTTNSYDSYSNLTQTKDALNRATSYTYDGTFQLYQTSATNALGQRITQKWDTVLGLPTESTDLNGNSTKTVYDVFGRVQHVSYPNNGSEVYSYADWGNPQTQRIRTTRGDGSSDGLWQEHFIDGLNRAWRVKSEGLNNKHSIQDTVFYRATELPEKESLPYLAGQTPQYTTYTYDPAQRLIKEQYADGSVARTEYGKGLRRDINELNQVTVTFLDAYGRATMVREWNGSDYYDTRYGYNVRNELTRVTNAQGHVTSFTWDTAGQQLALHDPDMGVTTYAYDAAGQLIRQTDARNKVTTYTYDALGRPLITRFNDSSQSSYSYDSATVNNGIGRLAQVAYPGGARRINAYTAAGNITSETRTVDNQNRTFSYSYDVLNRLKTLTYPDQHSVSYSYDAAGRLASVGGYVNAFTYTPGGQIAQITYANGVQENFSYSATRQWLNDHNVTNGTTLYQAAYTYDVAARIKKITSSTNTAWNLNLGYDALNRLTSVSGGQSQSFSYDALGNMLSNSAVGQYQYGDAKHVHAVTKAGTQSYAYDATGNMISGAGRTLVWNDANRLQRVTSNGATTNYVYDDTGQRIKKVSATQTVRYFGAELEVRNDVSTQYIYANGRLIARRTQDGSKTWYHHDHLGSVRVLTNAAGQKVKAYDYSAFGAVINAPGTGTSAYQYGSHEFDHETGLIYMKGRYYDPQLGRFISADPVVQGAGAHPQALNRYSYALNNPFAYTDPTGHFLGALFRGIGRIFKAVLSSFNVGLSLSGGTLSFQGSIGVNLGNDHVQIPLFNATLAQLGGGGSNSAVPNLDSLALPGVVCDYCSWQENVEIAVGAPLKQVGFFTLDPTSAHNRNLAEAQQRYQQRWTLHPVELNKLVLEADIDINLRRLIPAGASSVGGLDAKTARTLYSDLRTDLWKARTTWIGTLDGSAAIGVGVGAGGAVAGALAGGFGAVPGAMLGFASGLVGNITKANLDYSRATVYAVSDYWRKVGNETGDYTQFNYIQQTCANTCWGGTVPFPRTDINRVPNQ